MGSKTKKEYKVRIGWTEEKKEIYRDWGDCWDKGYEDGREEALEIINELQQKNDLLQLDFDAAQKIMGCKNQKIEELKKKLNKYEKCN